MKIDITEEDLTGALCQSYQTWHGSYQTWAGEKVDPAQMVAAARAQARRMLAADELLAACEDAAAMLAAWESGTRADAGSQKELGISWRSTEDARHNVLLRARAAIARAKGEHHA